jgi:hypothetical protein
MDLRSWEALMVDDWLREVKLVRDARAPIDRRVTAGRRLATVRDPRVLEALSALATADDLPGPVALEVGVAVATVAIALGRLEDVPLHDFAARAYLGYDEAIARTTRSDGQ